MDTNRAGTPVGSNRMTYLQRVQVIITGKQGGHHQLIISFKKYQNFVRHPLGVGNLNFVKGAKFKFCKTHNTCGRSVVLLFFSGATA